MAARRLIKNLLHLNHLRKFLGWEVFNKAIASEFKLEILDNPPKGNILVLSSHPDDDVFGCGGALCLHQKAGNKIKIIYLADGSGEKKSNPGRRQKEAREAALVLGVTDLDFWQIPDGRLSPNNSTIQRLNDLILKFQPDIIYAPSFIDSHPDHFETAAILAEALKKMPDFNGMIFSYEIWTPVFANRLINIDEAIELKKEAMAAHASQQNSRSYSKAILGLNQYRAGMFNHGQYAEAFFESNRELYINLFNLVNNPEPI